MNSDNPVTPFASVEANSHLATLALLRQVCDYLGRLPPHPMTHAVRGQLLDHLENPQTRHLQDRISTLSKAMSEAEEWSAAVAAGNAFTGSWEFAPSGAPILTAKLAGPMLRLESPAFYKSRGLVKEAIANGLEHRIEIALSKSQLNAT